jgi:serine/threonine-protein kinase
MVGRTLSHYRIVENLGAGGMGEVYLAEDTTLRRQVALKVLPPEMASDAGCLERLRREALAIASLNHPNIVTIHAIEETEGLLFIVMEWIEGRTLTDLIRTKGMRLREFFDLAIPLADALSTAHEHGVIHRDLKPGNIMVTNQGVAKILDFGLAKLHPAAETPIDTQLATEPLTAEGKILGTAPYMSPEQIQGKTVDERSDIFSLGIILYEMATGRRPFAGRTSAELVSSILRDQPSAVDELKGELPHHLGRIIRHCLEKQAERRLQSAKDLRNELEDLRQELESGQIEAGGLSSKAVSPSKAIWRRPWAWAAALTLVVLGLVLVFVLRGRGSSVTGYEEIAVLPFANLTGDPSQDYVGEGLGAGLITQLSEVAGLSIVGRSETWSYRGKGLSARQLGKRLGVEAVLEGGLQPGEKGLRADVNLTDVRTGRILWSQSFVGERQRLFAFQKTIASGVTRFLSIPLSVRERRRMARNPTESGRAYDYYLQGQQFLEAVDKPRNADFARDLFRQAIRIDPQFALARVGLSEALWKIHRRDKDSAALAEAEREAETASTLDPELPAAQVALARVYRDTGRYAESIAELRRILANHPNPDRAQGELAFSYEEAGDLSAAEECLRSAIALRDDYWHHWNSLGAFLVKLTRYPEARSAFQRAAELAPEGTTWPLRNLASVRMLEGDFEGAIEAFEQFGEEPDTAKLAGNIGTAYFFTHRLEEAERYYELAVRLDPRDPLKHGNLADLYLRQGRQDDARAEYRSALRLVEEALLDNPKSNSLRVRQALYSAKAGECQAASRLAAELQAELPQTGEFAHYRALVHAVCGQRIAALEALRVAIELGFSTELIREEDEFADLHKDPEFLDLVGTEL